MNYKKVYKLVCEQCRPIVFLNTNSWAYKCNLRTYELFLLKIKSDPECSKYNNVEELADYFFNKIYLAQTERMIKTSQYYLIDEEEG